MMSFRHLEQYVQLLQVIQNYETLIRSYDSTLKAYCPDGFPRTHSRRNDQMDEILIKKDRALERLPRLRILLEEQKQEVEMTISLAVKNAGRNRIKAELIFHMRYCNGSTWEEIGALLGETPSKLKAIINQTLTITEAT